MMTPRSLIRMFSSVIQQCSSFENGSARNPNPTVCNQRQHRSRASPFWSTTWSFILERQRLDRAKGQTITWTTPRNNSQPRRSRSPFPKPDCTTPEYLKKIFHIIPTTYKNTVKQSFPFSRSILQLVAPKAALTPSPPATYRQHTFPPRPRLFMERA